MNISATIEIPAAVVVTSRGIETRIETSGLSDSILSALLLHGLNQKVSDAASGAAALAVKDKFGDKAKPSEHKDWLAKPEATKAIAAHTQALMDKAADALLRGEWSQRGSGGAVDETTLVQRSIAKAALKAKLGGESTEWKDFLALDASDANAKLDTIFDKNAAKLLPSVEAELSARALRRAKPKVDIDL